MPDRPSIEQLEKQLLALQRENSSLKKKVADRSHDHIRLKAIMESAIHTIIVVDDQARVVTWPSQAELLCGWRADEMLGEPIYKIMPHRIRERHQGLFQEVLNGRRGHIFGKQLEASILYRGDFEVPVELAVSLARVGDHNEFTIFMHDITERKGYEAQLHHVSITDELTGVFNRRGFMTLADKQLKMACRENDDIFLLYADFDNMKWINDTHGHGAGDQALVETANILKTTFRQADLIGRIGGDEFTVLITDRKGVNTPETVIARLQEALDQANDQSTREFKIQLSLGTVHYNHDTPCTINDLLIQADRLMYEDKRRRKQHGLANYRD